MTAWHETPLDRFVAEAEDPSWTCRGWRCLPAGGRRYCLELASLRWRGTVWRQRVSFFVPDRLNGRNTALVWAEGGIPGAAVLERLEDQGRRLGAPVAIVADLPNQPLFGRWENELMWHSFARYLETGEETWPLMLPLAGATVRAVDALQAFCGDCLGIALQGYVLEGASKRGWSAWLTAAVDPRVRGVCAAVFDLLDIPAQVARHRQLFGGVSPRFGAPEARRVLEQMGDARGAGLCACIDPIAYRERLTMPKLVVLGTNDGLWAPDGLALYQKALPGTTAVAYVPNAGHGFGYPPRLLRPLEELYRQATGQPSARAQLEWTATQRAEGTRLEVPGPPDACGWVWSAQSPAEGFEQAQWTRQPVAAPAGAPWSATIKAPPGAYAAAFIEAEVVAATDTEPVLFATPVVLAGPG